VLCRRDAKALRGRGLPHSLQGAAGNLAFRADALPSSGSSRPASSNFPSLQQPASRAGGVEYNVSKWVLRLVAILIGAGLVYMVGSRVYELKEEQSSPKAGAKKKGGARVVSVDLASANIGQVREVLLLTGALKPKESV